MNACVFKAVSAVDEISYVVRLDDGSPTLLFDDLQTMSWFVGGLLSEGEHYMQMKKPTDFFCRNKKLYFLEELDQGERDILKTTLKDCFRK